MRTSMSAMSLPDPEFKQDQTGSPVVRVTLRNNVHQRRVWVDKDVGDLVGSLIAKQLCDDEKRLLNFAAEHGQVGVSDAQKLLNCTWPAGKKKLVKLATMGILVHDVRKGLNRDPQARFRLAKSES